MNEREQIHLPDAAQALLDDWPIAEPDAQACDERARRITARIADVAIGSTPDELLTAPLGSQPGEGDSEGSEREPASKPAVANADEPSFAEMARAMVRKKSDDASAIARESLSLANEARRSTPEIVERVRRASVPPPAAEAQAVQGVDAPSGRAPTRAQRRPNYVPAIIGAVALAAAVALWMKTHSRSEVPVATAPAAATATTSPINPPTQTPVSPGESPAVPQKLAAGPAAIGKAGSAKPRVAMGGPPTAAPPSSAKAADKIVLEETPATTEPALPAPSGPLRPADGIAAQIPDAPSQGAIVAALAGPKRTAAQCVVGQSDGTSATVVFGGLDGAVRSVSVSGPAQGTPAEACIQRALSQAKVSAFARDTFSVRIPVRP